MPCIEPHSHSCPQATGREWTEPLQFRAALGVSKTLHKHRHACIHAHRHTHTHRERETHTDRHTHTHTETDRETQTDTGVCAYECADKHTGTKTKHKTQEDTRHNFHKARSRTKCPHTHTHTHARTDTGHKDAEANTEPCTIHEHHSCKRTALNSKDFEAFNSPALSCRCFKLRWTISIRT